MLIRLARAALILLSLFCVVANAAAFTAAVGLSMILLVLCGILGYMGNIKLAIINLGLNSFAISLSPIAGFESFSHSIVLTVLYTVPFVLGFGGLLLGVLRQDKGENTRSS